MISIIDVANDFIDGSSIFLALNSNTLIETSYNIAS